MSFRDQCFSSKNRLTKPSEFREVFASDKRIAEGGFVTLFRDNQLEVARLGLVVSRKSVRLASNRNRLKRMVRESFRKYKHELAGRDVVVIVRKNIQPGNRGRIDQLLANHWERIINA